MPDRSGTWDVGFPALLPEHPATNPSIPTSGIPISDKKDQHDRFPIFKRLPNAQPLSISLPSALINLMKRPTLPPLCEGLKVILMTSPGCRLFRFQPLFAITGGEFASIIQCLTLPLSSFASKPIST